MPKADVSEIGTPGDETCIANHRGGGRWRRLAVAILDDDVRGIQVEVDAVTVMDAVRLISAKLNALPKGNFRAMVARKASAGVWTLTFRAGTGRRFRR